MSAKTYDNYNFCTRCTKWIPKGERCPDHPNYKLRTKRQQKRFARMEAVRI